jgi:hypothetical protein
MGLAYCQYIAIKTCGTFSSRNLRSAGRLWGFKEISQQRRKPQRGLTGEIRIAPCLIVAQTQHTAHKSSAQKKTPDQMTGRRKF